MSEVESRPPRFVLTVRASAAKTSEVFAGGTLRVPLVSGAHPGFLLDQ